MTREQALEAYNAAREAANDAWQVWCGNAHTGASAAEINRLAARWKEACRVEREALAALNQCADLAEGK